MRRRRIATLIVACTLALVAADPLQSEERPAPLHARSSKDGGRRAALRRLRQRAIERRRELEEMEPIPAIVERGTIDKGAIAAKVRAGMKTLKELGNPHIPDGFLLKKAQDDPTRQVDDVAMSEYCAMMLRARSLSPREAHEALHSPGPAGAAEPSVPAASPPESSSGSGTSFGAFALVLAVGALAAGFVLLRRRRSA